ncbi:PREDICTED: uncharacterized protein LOC106813396 [Priapulus caudatus]|uniref:Uncharacterized protein LOC106813396 n=1 Tax=Priapulus caudatus TaxID=37621 RepID=A0ABM1ELE7_PRICU|nr:PREDICTED: uncharacterized protein LOC106813396 [Priapulus caudatus]
MAFTRENMSDRVEVHVRPGEVLSETEEAQCCTADGCRKTFRKRRNLKRHLQEKHGPIVRKFVCPYCDQLQASRRDDIGKHIRKWHQDRPTVDLATIQYVESRRGELKLDRAATTRKVDKETSKKEEVGTKRRRIEYPEVKGGKHTGKEKEIDPASPRPNTLTLLDLPREETNSKPNKVAVNINTISSAWNLAPLGTSPGIELRQKNGRANLRMKRLRDRIGKLQEDLKQEEVFSDRLRDEIRKEEESIVKEERRRACEMEQRCREKKGEVERGWQQTLARKEELIKTLQHHVQEMKATAAIHERDPIGHLRQEQVLDLLRSKGWDLAVEKPTKEDRDLTPAIPPATAVRPVRQSKCSVNR